MKIEDWININGLEFEEAKVGLGRDNTENFVCHLSEEQMRQFGQAKYLEFRGQGTATIKLAKVKLKEDEEDANEDRGMTLWVKPVWSLPVLEKITLSVDNVDDFDPSCIEEMLTQHESVPCMEGQNIKWRKSQKGQNDLIHVLVEETEPFIGGLWTGQTEVVIVLMDNDNQDILNDSSVLSYAKSVWSSPTSMKSFSAEAVKKRDFPYEIGEISPLLSRFYLSQPISESLTVVINNNQRDRFQFCWIQSSSGKSILLPCQNPNEIISGEPCLLLPPSLLELLRHTFDCPKLMQVRMTPFTDLSSIPSATEAFIAFISTPNYDQLTASQVEGILTSFFNSKRYLISNQIVEISLDGCDIKSLPWEILKSGSIFFKVLEINIFQGSGLSKSKSDGIIGAYVSSETTRLYQKPKLRTRLPPRKKMLSASGLRQVSVAPPFIWKLATTIAKQVLYGHAASFLVSGKTGSGIGKFLIKALESLLGLSSIETDSSWLVADTSGGTEAKLRQWFSRIRAEGRPCLAVFKDVLRLGKNREGKTDHRVLDRVREEIKALDRSLGMVIVGECETMREVEKGLAVCFDAKIDTLEKEQLSLEGRVAVLKWICRKKGICLSRDVDLADLARRTSGFLLEDLQFTVRRAMTASRKRILKNGVDSSFFSGNNNTITNKLNGEDFASALKEVQSSMADAVGAPKIPEVRWEDVGGLEEAKKEILDTIQLPLAHPELLEGGGKRSGVLMYGPPGVGKTLLAKAVATECSLNFLSVKGPELLNMYVGQSEENVRAVFSRAKSASPCVVFFDELDSLAPNRGRTGDSGGVMDRVVSQLLGELDSVAESNNRVFVIGATNRPDLLDPSLLRPGRFDRLVYLGVGGQDPQERRRILHALTRNFHLSKDLSVDRISDSIIPTDIGPLTGADLAAICSGAAMNALARRVRQMDREWQSDADSNEELEVNEQDFRDAVFGFTPSVSQADLEYYETLKEM